MSESDQQRYDTPQDSPTADAYEKVCAARTKWQERAERAEAALAAAQRWKAAVNESLVVSRCLSETNKDDPERAINDLLCQAQKEALDPLISAEAIRLQEKVWNIALDSAAIVCELRASVNSMHTFAQLHWEDAEAIRALKIAAPQYDEATIKARDNPADAATVVVPIDMLLFCPRCQMQHIDAPQPEQGWTNPPHATHTCQGCGLIWRPSNALTNGAATIEQLEPKHAERIAASHPPVQSEVAAAPQPGVQRDEAPTVAALPDAAAWDRRLHRLLTEVRATVDDLDAIAAAPSGTEDKRDDKGNGE